MTGVRRVDRPGQAVVRALGEQVALDLRAAWRWWRRPPAWCWSPALVPRDGSRTAPRRGSPVRRVALRARRSACRRPRRRRRPRSPRPSAPTTTSPSRADRAAEAAGVPCSRPRHLPTRGAAAGADPPGRPTARRPRPRPRARRDPRRGPDARRPRPTRSKIAAAGTIGTGPPRVGNPRPCSASARITPSAAASPNADPPVSTIASTCSTVATGRAARSRGSPARRRGSRPTRPCSGGSTTTVTPVAAPVQCPTRTPGTSVITSARRRGWRRRPGRRRAWHLAREVHDQRVELVGALVHEHVAGARVLDQPRVRAPARRSGARRAAA